MNSFLKLLGVAFLMYFSYGVALPFYFETKFSEPISNSEEEITFIKNYRGMNAPTVIPHGRFSVESDKDGKKFEITYIFENDNSMTKEFNIEGKYHLRGSAEYKFHGSTIVFSNVKGHKAMFGEQGEVIEINNDQEIALLSSNNRTLILKKVL